MIFPKLKMHLDAKWHLWPKQKGKRDGTWIIHNGGVRLKLSLLFFLDTKFPVNSSANNGVVFPQGDVTGAICTPQIQRPQENSLLFMRFLGEISSKMRKSHYPRLNVVKNRPFPVIIVEKMEISIQAHAILFLNDKKEHVSCIGMKHLHKQPFQAQYHYFCLTIKKFFFFINYWSVLPTIGYLLVNLMII